MNTMNEEALIILVQEHECLYNLSHREYDNNLLKDNIWKNISMNLYTTIAKCKSKWTLLRSYYRKALQRKKTKSGQPAKNVKKWRYEAQMEFLKPHMQERETTSNLSCLLSTLSENDADDNTENAESEDSQLILESQMDEVDSLPTSPSLSLEPIATTSKNVTTSRSRQEKTVKPPSLSSSTPVNLKRKTLDDNNLSETLANFIKFKQSTVVRNIEPTFTTKKRSLVTFFDDIADTILSFPELQQAEIKRDIFTIVNSKQIELLQRSV